MAAQRTRRTQPEFIPNGPSLYALTGFTPQSVRSQHSTKRGALVPILTRFGNRLGVWRADWIAFAESQRKLREQGKAA